jgi:sulfoxide reductase heme-binding subunit YedZ
MGRTSGQKNLSRGHACSRFTGRVWAAAAPIWYAPDMKSWFQLWRDRRGRVSVLRIATLGLLLTPVLLAVAAALTEERFGARPLNDLIHRTGYWALVFLLTSLAVTPLRRIARFGGLMDVRRMIGVGAFAYAATHISLFITDQMFDLGKVASEIALRLYLTIGFTALLGLSALAATSTDAMVRRVGGLRWRRLHQLSYAIALLALIHFFQQTKLDVGVPTFVAGLFAWLMGYRLIAWRKRTDGELSTWALLGLTVTVAALTFAGEAIGIAIAFHVSPLMVLAAALDFDLDSIRPGWLVLGAGLCVVALDLVRGWSRKRRPPARPTPARVSTAPARELV